VNDSGFNSGSKPFTVYIPRVNIRAHTAAAYPSTGTEVTTFHENLPLAVVLPIPTGTVGATLPTYATTSKLTFERFLPTALDEGVLKLSISDTNVIALFDQSNDRIYPTEYDLDTGSGANPLRMLTLADRIYYAVGLNPGTASVTLQYLDTNGTAVCSDSVAFGILSVDFEETAPNNGFDDTVDPPWLVVPVNNPPNQNTVKVNIEPSAVAAQVYFTIDDPAKATVSPAQASSSPQTLTLTGVAKGHTALRARVGSSSGPICKTLNVCVRDKKVVDVDFHFMQDNASNQTSRSTSEADGFVSTLNSIWMPQANVVFQKGSVDSPTVPTNLGSVVEWYPTNPANEWDDIAAFRNGSAPDVFFVWEYEQDGTPATDNADAAQLGGDILFEDNAGSQVGETMAHEMGHFLSVSPADYTDRQDQLMHAYTDVRGQKITHAQVDQANP
ncbi:MAG: Ig-like domain-containing protein, partial [Kiritimatiellae bacterium]|nr:Ig-like domain-containing protein [Kiritimatiellia bacterium]